MFLMDRFFDGTFFTFGIEVLSFAERDQEDRIDPMVCTKRNHRNINACLHFYTGLYFPPDDKVYFSQVRNEWRYRKT